MLVVQGLEHRDQAGARGGHAQVSLARNTMQVVLVQPRRGHVLDGLVAAGPGHGRVLGDCVRCDVLKEPALVRPHDEPNALDHVRNLGLGLFGGQAAQCPARELERERQLDQIEEQPQVVVAQVQQRERAAHGALAQGVNDTGHRV